MFENSKWIARDDNTEKITPAPIFRKSFDVALTVKKATLYACGLGHACYYINGRNITDEVLTTPVSKYDSRVYYSEFDVTDFLCGGKNVLACMLGNGWYFVTFPRWDYYKPDWLHHPKLISELKIEYTDGTEQTVVSDPSWKVSDGAVVYNEDRRGEIFDARLWREGWNDKGFDDSGWKNAFICRGPGGILQKTDFPPIRVTKCFKAVKLSETVYDIGQNISGWVRLRLRGKEGTEVTVRYAERLRDDGSIAPEYLNTIAGSDTHTDKYILSGRGTEEWAPRFAYHGFRYAEITGSAELVEVIGEVVHSDVGIKGNFECSDPMLNKIHSASVWSTLCNIQGIITDCPQREQNGWTGDALLSADQTLMNIDIVPIYRKWLRDIRDTQRPNGQICCLAPTSGWGYNWGSGPAWDSALILIPYLIFKYTGDKSVLEENWQSMVLYMEFAESMSYENEVCFGLGDWCPPRNVTDICPTAVTDTTYFYTDNKTMAICAELLGKDGTVYQRRAEEIKNAFRCKYMDDDFFLNDNTTAIACAVYQDLYTDIEKPAAAKRLNELFEKNGFHINCGILGVKYLYTALSEYGYAETAYKLTTNPEFPSYAYWILNGMTTLCENWEFDTSCNHHMYSEVDMWLYKYIAGIRINDGAGSAVIRPCFIPEIKWVRANCGGVSVYYDDKKAEITTDIPATYIGKDGNPVSLSAGHHVISV